MIAAAAGSLFDQLLRHPLAERLGWTLVHSLWQFAAVAALLVLVLLLLKRASASARYAAACAALLACLASTIVTFGLQGEASQLVVERLVDAPDTVPADVSLTMVTTQYPAAHSGFAERAEAMLPWTAVAWVIGVVALSLWNAAGWVRVQRLRHTSRVLTDDRCMRMMARLCASMRLRRPVVLALSDRIDAPSVIGCFKAVVLVPMSALSGLPPQELEALLAHELAHVRRWDYLANLVQTVVETLLFYHPAVWWIGRVIRQEREHCCDDLAAELCGDRHRYATALARMEELRLGSPTISPALAANGGALLPRIRRLLGAPPPPRGQRRARSLPVALVVLACVALPLLVGKLQARQQPSETAAPTTQADEAQPRDRADDSGARPRPQAQADHELRQLLEKRLPEFKMDNTSFGDAIEFLRDVTGANIFVNWRALEAVGINRDSPISLRVRDVSLDKVLRLMLQQLSGADFALTYAADENVITISTEEDLARDVKQSDRRPAAAEYYLAGVERSGTYALTPDAITLKQAVIAGGITDAEEKHLVLVRRDPNSKSIQRAVYPIDQLMRTRVGNEPVQPGDVLMVTGEPPATQPADAAARYRIEGRVANPGVYSLKGRELMLLQAIVAAGTNPAEIPDKWVTVYRVSASGQHELVYSSQLKQMLLEDRMLPLQPGDSVFVTDEQPDWRGGRGRE